MSEQKPPQQPPKGIPIQEGRKPLPINPVQVPKTPPKKG